MDENVEILVAHHPTPTPNQNQKNSTSTSLGCSSRELAAVVTAVVLHLKIICKDKEEDGTLLMLKFVSLVFRSPWPTTFHSSPLDP